RGLQQRDSVVPCPATCSEADRHVEPFPQDLDAVVVGRYPEIDLRMGLMESTETWHQPTKCEGRVNADVQYRDVAPCSQTIKGWPHSVKSMFEYRKQKAAFIGGHQALRGPQEQCRPEQVLKSRDLVADRGLGHAQLDHGLREAALAHGDFKHA